MKYTFKHTINACYLGYITQAIVNNLAPLLFVIFNTQFAISLEKIGLLIVINFGVQLLTDLVAAFVLDKTGWRVPVVLAHVLSAAGLVLMSVLPNVMADPYIGLVISMVCMAVGGGLIEVLVSPIVEACPGDEKAAAMSMLHSFYSWGQAAVVLLSTLYFVAFSQANWSYLPLIWAIIPAFNIFLFARVPLGTLVDESERVPLKKLFRANVFWVLLLLMVCAGASEQAMSQWSSLFAELGLGISKTLGDMAGPFAFAILMGVARLFYGIMGPKIKLANILTLSAVLCVISYLVAVFSPIPQLSLVGCALCGLSVGIMWPGVFSLSASSYPQGGTAMFAMLALAGDLGCASGPGLVGLLSGAVQTGAISFVQGWFPGLDLASAGLRFGMLCAIAFPVLLLLGVLWLRRRRERIG